MSRALLAAILAAAAGCLGAPAAATGFEATHIDSRPHDDGFVEVFRIDEVRDARPLAEIVFVLDGAAIVAEWQDDADATLSIGDRFSFVADAFDRPRHLEALAGSAVLWAIDYGGGAGDPSA